MFQSNIRRVCSFLLLGLGVVSGVTHAAEDSTPAATAAPAAVMSEIKTVLDQAAPCGILENFMGDVQILDASRTHLIDATHRAAIACGSWVSVNEGWVQIRHQNGPHLHLGRQTYVQFSLRHDATSPESYPESQDQLTLYRGLIYVQAGGGEEEFRILSASGRARVKHGKIIFLFNSKENESQLIALENSATLENRFESNRKVTLQAGETSELNFTLERIIPSLPKAISIASLKPKLADLRILESDQSDAIRTALRRQSRKFASSFLVNSADRKVASELKNYNRHQTDSEDPELRAYRVQKMVGGETVGERILFPDKYYGRSQKIHVEVEDPAAKLNLRKRAAEELEKKRLIDELSQIKVE